MKPDVQRAPLRDFPPQTFTLLNHLVNACPGPIALRYEVAQHWAKNATGAYEVLTTFSHGRRVLALLEARNVIAYVDVTKPGQPSVQVVSRKGLWELMESLQRAMLYLWMDQLDASRDCQRTKFAANSSPDLGFRSANGEPLSLRSYSGSGFASRLLVAAHRHPMYRYDPSKPTSVAAIKAFIEVSNQRVSAQMVDGAVEHLAPVQVFSLDCAVCELPRDVDVVALLSAYCNRGPYYKVLLVEAVDSVSACHYRVTAAQFDPLQSMHYRFATLYVANPETLCILKDKMGKEQGGRIDETTPLVSMLQPLMVFWA